MKKHRTLIEISEEFDQAINNRTLSKEERKRRMDALLTEARPEVLKMFSPLFRGFEELVAAFHQELFNTTPRRKRRAKKGGAS